MKIGVACGGTGGHVFPGLAAAKVLRGRGHEVTLWIGGREVEKVSVEDWDGPVVRVVSAGFAGAFSWRSLNAIHVLAKAVWTCRQTLKRQRPAALLAMGSYASVGPVCAARILGIPVVLHEANAVPGLAISFLSRFASTVAVSFGSTVEHVRHSMTVLTGFPVRDDLDQEPFGEPLVPGMFTVLVMGGSQGAHRLNEVATAAICRVRERGAPIQVVHLSGRDDEGFVRQAYERAGVTHVVKGFLREIGRAYRSADLAVARAGAGTCAELATCGLPALLVPLSLARRNHQLANARALQVRGGVDVIEEENLTPSWLADYIQNCQAKPKKLEAMRNALNALAVAGAADRIADLVERAAKARQVTAWGT